MSRKKITGGIFSEVWERIISATPIKNLTQLAEIIGTSQPNASKIKKKGEFPAEWAFRIAREYGISTEWLMTGEGPRSLEGGSKDDIFRGSLAEWIREKSKDDPDFWLNFAADCAAFFPEYAEWLKKRKATVVSGSDHGQLAA